MYRPILLCVVDIRDTQPYFDTMDNVLRQLLRMFDETVAQAGETEALIGVHVPEVYHEVDASQSGTCVQWNMENNQWDSFITNILQPLHAADGGYGLPPKLFDE